MLNKILNSPVLNTWFSNTVILFNSVIIIPIVISKLTTEELNVWFLMFTIIALSQGVVFGFNATFMRFIAYSYAGVPIEAYRNIKDKTSLEYKELNRNELSEIIALMKQVYKIISMLFVLVLALSGYFFMKNPIGALPHEAEGWYTWGFVVATATLSLYMSHYQLILEGMNKVVLVQRIIGLVNFIGFFCIMTVVFFNLTLFSAVAVYQVISLAVFVFFAFYVRKEKKEIGVQLSDGGFNKILFKLVWESAWKSGVTTLMANIVKHISSLIIANLFSPAQSASFQFTKRLFDVIERFTMVTFQAKLPLIAKLRGRGDFKALMPELRTTQYLAYGVFLTGYTILIFFGEPILLILKSNVELGSFWLILLFSFSTFLSRWGGMAAHISNQSNHVIEHIQVSIIMIVFFAVIICFYKQLGINVFPLAQAVGILAVMPITAKLVYKTLHTSFWSYEKQVMLPIATVLVAVNIVYLMINA